MYRIKNAVLNDLNRWWRVIILAFHVLAASIFVTGCSLPPLLKNTASDSVETEYFGRVIDMNTQLAIETAEVTLDLQGVPQIDYTDTEGVYQFSISIDSAVSATIRVNAEGYQPYTRNIQLSPSQHDIDDIRLIPKPLAVQETQWDFTSSDGIYGVRRLTASNSAVHCEVIETSTYLLILTTHAKYASDNAVKNCGFSGDNSKFAAAYHYANNGNYTWIGVWSVPEGDFLYAWEKPEWTTDLSGVFDGPP